jgi:hypothetical protein
VDELRTYLVDEAPEEVGIRGVSNARVMKEAKALEIMGSENRPATVGQLREVLGQIEGEVGIEPEEMWRMGEELGYRVEISWAMSDERGSYDAVLIRRTDEEGKERRAIRFPEPNIKVYILDSQLEPVAVVIAGQLHISGPG